ncbi:MAG: tetratricopeptide repeat protein [Candidatus Glassbacteria bacterium]|nr:tetratricopeptide repeat protein [Candidatus Glassbacteria bacterium]
MPMADTQSSNRRILGFLAGIGLALAVLYSVQPACAAPDDTERDLKGFDEQMVRQQKALRALQKGKSYLKDRSFELARKSFVEALTLNMDLHEARFCLGLAEYRDGKFKLAAAQFESLYEKVPDFENLRLELARAYLALGECSTARKWLQRHLELDRDGDSKEADKLKREIDKCSNRQERRS